MSINNYDVAVYKVTFCRNYLLTKNMFMMFDIIYKYIMYNICRKYLLIKNTLEFDMIYKKNLYGLNVYIQLCSAGRCKKLFIISQLCID